MSIELDIWKTIGFISSLIGAFWVLIKIIVIQFNNGLAVRFAALEASRKESSQRDTVRFDRIESSLKIQEREILMLKAELPDKYVKREDAIRSEMTLHAKFDALAGRIDMYLRAKT